MWILVFGIRGLNVPVYYLILLYRLLTYIYFFLFDLLASGRCVKYPIKSEDMSIFPFSCISFCFTFFDVVRYIRVYDTKILVNYFFISIKYPLLSFIMIFCF